MRGRGGVKEVLTYLTNHTAAVDLLDYDLRGLPDRFYGRITWSERDAKMRTTTHHPRGNHHHLGDGDFPKVEEFYRKYS